MFDFQLITNQNGWSMAITGASIVFTGLVLLSFAVSQLHRIVGLMERKKGDAPALETDTSTAKADMAFPSVWPADARASADLLDPVVSPLGAAFTMADLYAAAAENDLPHPHITFTQLRQEGILAPSGAGTFTWQR